jgi:ribosomal protein S18 acetylase RimI-like enzyme
MLRVHLFQDDEMPTIIRRTASADYNHWLRLWTEYCLFYGREPEAEVTAYTWSRLMNPASSIFGTVAEVDGRVVGIANCVMHENTSTLQPVCYLQDLYVDPEARAGGIGKQMIDWLQVEMKTQGWARVYWATKENNYRARGMYDKFTPHSGFLRYVVYNPDFQK